MRHPLSHDGAHNLDDLMKAAKTTAIAAMLTGMALQGREMLYNGPVDGCFRSR
jgi:hypothetical protein